MEAIKESQESVVKEKSTAKSNKKGAEKHYMA